MHRQGEYLALVGILLSCVVLVSVITSTSRPTVLFSQSELNEIDYAENRDSSMEGLSTKNDDGHTRMWNAQSTHTNPITHQAVKKARASTDMYGMPRFYAHATGWVNDIGSPRDRFGLPKKAASPVSLKARTTSLLSNNAMEEIESWDSAAKKMARTQQLWNAAGNDEITLSNIGHDHPSEMAELQKNSPEFHAAAGRSHITHATAMSFHPLKWMHEQREPGAIEERTRLGARIQELWNAGANDVVGGEGSPDDSSDSYHPIEWLSEQRDPAEQGSLSASHVYGGRVFQEGANHVRNYDGSYVNDNSIGVKIDELKGRQTILAQMLNQTAGANSTSDSAHDALLKKLDDMRDMAMSAYDSLPDEVSPVVRGIARDDYQMVIDYLDAVASVATGIPRGNYNASASTFEMSGSDKVISLAVVSEVGEKKVVQALGEGLRGPFEKLKEQLDRTGEDETDVRQALVLKALSDACDNAAVIMSSPTFARHEAAVESK